MRENQEPPKLRKNITTSGIIHLYGKPNERLIAIGLCKRFNLTFNYDESKGTFTYTGQRDKLVTFRSTYDKIIANAYKALAFASARKDLSGVPLKTLNTEFMQAFAAMTYCISTGEPFMFKSETEAHRAGLGAVGQAVK